ncbi:hypothetical protein NBRC116188_00660 [Oceaniserpentilla sp. 4NH20-0058]|uniref:hypothetical protein n=1 Tax=Oceaniserpentilla sp. 4NH20-0058 TaxID=3127660 RepID=UPI003106BFF8
MDCANFMAYFGAFIFLLLVIGGIIYAQKVAQKEQELRLLIAKSKRLLHRAGEVWEIIQDAKDLVGNAEVIETLLQYYAYILNQREHIFPQQDTGGLLAQADTFKTQYNPSAATLELTNDFEIKHCKNTFASILKILKAATSKNIIHTETYMELENQLKQKQLHLEVAAYEKLGDIAGENKNPAVATNYYKYAKKLLIESNVKYENKHEHIRSITEKNQKIFGNVIKDKIEKQQEAENTQDEFGFPTDLNVMSGKARKD